MNPAPQRATVAVLAAVVVVGVALRLLPWLLDPSIALRDDAAFHERIVRETVALGRVPEVDRLSEPPTGRRLADHLPLGLYVTAAAFHDALAPLDHADVRVHLMLWIAVCGALTALPVYAATRAMGAGPVAGWLAAAIVATLPAHLHRTFGYWVRYDAAGVLLAMTHVAFALRALRESKTRRADAALSAVFLVAAAAMWRVSLALAPLEAAWAILAIAVAGAGRPLRDWLLAVAFVGTLGFLRIDPMRAQHFATSAGWAPMLAAAALACVPAARPGGRAPVRITAALVALAVAVAGALWLGPAEYGGTLELIAFKLTALAGHIGNASPLARLQLDVVELFGLTPVAFAFGPQQFLALGPWFLAAPILLVRARAQTVRGALRGFGGAWGLLAALAVSFTVLTLAFARNKVLLAPVLAVVCACAGAALWRNSESSARLRPGTGTERSGARARRAPAGPQPSMARLALRGLFALSVAATAVCGVLLASSRHSEFEPSELEVLHFLREHTPASAVIAAPWWYGYEIEAVAGRPALTDGLLESPANQRRILGLFHACLSRDPAELVTTCARDSARYLLVPPPETFSHVAWVADPRIAEHIDRGLSATPDERGRVLVRLMRREPVPGFEPAFENDEYRVVKVDFGAAGLEP